MSKKLTIMDIRLMVESCIREISNELQSSNTGSSNKYIVYHGSSLKEEELCDDRWTYFTDNEGYASEFGMGKNGSNVHKAEITINKPLLIPSLDGSIWDYEDDENGDEQEVYAESFLDVCEQLHVTPKVFEDYEMFDDIDHEYNSLWQIVNDVYFCELCERAGYDGIISEESGNKVYITFHPNQIKWLK